MVDSSDFCDTLTRFVASHDKSDSECTTKKEAMSIYFEDIAEKMIKFPEVDQEEAKREIFNLVNKKNLTLQAETEACAVSSFPVPTIYTKPSFIP
jgi:hypothetical protein